MELQLRCPAVGEVVVELLPEIGDELRSQLLSVLPWEGSVIHSRRSGYEVFLALPPLAPAPDRACLRSEVGAGDVLLMTFPPAYRDAPPTSVADTALGYSHLGFLYDDAAVPATPAGTVAEVPVIGRVRSTLPALRDIGALTRAQGAQPASLLSSPSDPEDP